MSEKSFETKRFVVKMLSVLLAVCLCVCCVSCAKTNYVSKTYLMMDTVIEIKLICDYKTAQPIFARCGEMMSQMESVLSRTV